MDAKILIADDDRKSSALIGVYLKREGFDPLFAFDGGRALTLIGDHSPDLMILDVILPVVDGWQVCRKLRETSDMPVLILTARGEEAERVLGLSLGADDYVVKPFSPRELMERVKAVLRRTARQYGDRGEVLESEGLRVDTGKRKVTLNGMTVALTPCEYSLLTALMSAPGRVFSRRQLMRNLYPAGVDVVERVVDVHLGKLRRKLSQAPGGVKFIQTIRGIGYSFTEGERVSSD